jgi:hypothetical protein
MAKVRPTAGEDFHYGLDPWKGLLRPRRQPAKQAPLFNEVEKKHVTPGRAEHVEKLDQAARQFVAKSKQSYHQRQAAEVARGSMSPLGNLAKSTVTPKQRAAWNARAARERGE